MKKIICGLFVLISVVSLHAAELVVNKKCNAEILLSPKAGEVERFAAEELSNYVGKITGTELPVVRTKSNAQVTVQYFLQNGLDQTLPAAVLEKQKKIFYDGSVIYVAKNRIAIIAKRESGFLYATYYLLAKYGDCRWFTANPGDEYTAKSSSFIVPDQLLLRNPVFEKRNMMVNGVTPPEALFWMVRNGYNITHGPMIPTKNKNVAASYPMKRKLGQNVGALGKGFESLLTNNNKRLKADMFKKHPEYFGLRDGKRVLCGLDEHYARKPVSQPCLTNPEVVRIMVNNEAKILSALPENTWFDCVYGNDDYRFWCECPKCCALDDPKAAAFGKRSDRWWSYVNEFAAGIRKKCPREGIAMEFFAYQDYRDVPRLVKPDPGVSVMVCPHGRCYVHALNDPACPENRFYRKMFTDWQKTGIRVTAYEYHTELPGPSAYVPVEKAWIRDLKDYHSMKMRGYLLCWFFPTQPLSNNPARHYFFRNMNQSLWQTGCLSGVFSWDIHADYDKVWEDFNSKYYGAAWKYMKPYRRLLEDAVKNSGTHMRYGSSSSATLGRCYDQPGLGRKAHELLAQALAAAKNDPVRLKRVQKEKEYFILNWEQSGFSAGGRDSAGAIRIPRADARISLDGKLDEAAWKNAVVVKNFMVLGKSNVLANPQTTARLFCTDDDLYIGIEAEKSPAGERDITTKSGVQNCNGSYLQVFLAPNALNGSYYLLSMTHNGFKGDALLQDNLSIDETKPCGFEYKSVKDSRKWTVEMRIPGVKLGGLKNGSLTLLNIGRFTLAPNGKGQHSSNCIFPKNEGFHHLKSHKLFCFGNASPIVNPSFDEIMKVNTSPKAPKTSWIFKSGTQPKWWYFSSTPSEGGILTVITEKPANGKYAIRVQKTGKMYPRFGQTLTRGKIAKSYTMSMKVRGKGVFLILSDGAKNQEFSVNSAEWKTIGAEFSPGRRKALIIQLNGGAVDFDDVKVEALQDISVMPDAAKHQ